MEQVSHTAHVSLAFQGVLALSYQSHSLGHDGVQACVLHNDHQQKHKQQNTKVMNHTGDLVLPASGNQPSTKTRNTHQFTLQIIFFSPEERIMNSMQTQNSSVFFRKLSVQEDSEGYFMTTIMRSKRFSSLLSTDWGRFKGLRSCFVKCVPACSDSQWHHTRTQPPRRSSLTSAGSPRPPS